jgi:outer membrane receptor protein involved in Fe transport
LRIYGYAFPLLGAALLLPVAAAAQTPSVPEQVLITASPLPGTAIDPNKIPLNIQTLSSADLERFGAASALNTLADEIAGVSIANAQGNPYQPNLFYRGFEASPLAGDAQGLAVYADGVRLNQPFGDTLNWELIPDVAIDSLTLEGSNPVFGLNALGGSIAIAMKNGFSFQGTEAEAVGGSFNHWQSSVQYGLARGNRAFYVAANGVSEEGWRQHSPSRLVQLYADGGLRGDNGELHFSLSGAATKLTGNGTAPVELLAADRSHVFTYPDETKNTYGLANLHGTRRLSGGVALQGNVYLSRLHQRTRNGDTTEATPCVGTPGFLCLKDDIVLTDPNGDSIVDFLSGGTYLQLNSSATDTTGYGAALQISYDSLIGSRANKLIAGAAFDGGRTVFAAQSEIGALGPDRGFVGPGILIDQANRSIAPVKVTSKNQYYGFFVTDVFDVTEAFSLNASARYNIARIELDDDLGMALNGEHRYERLNPAFGASYQFSNALTLYASYSEANRAPTPAEFSCADPAAPCSLTNFFVGDPDLKEVVAHSVEVGLRGQTSLASGMSLQWHVGLYRTDTSDDIMLVSSAIIGRAFFENVGNARRQGLESSLDLRFHSWSASFHYSYTEATFRSAFTLNSPRNPFADANGEIQVVSGDRLPSVPAHLFKATIGYELSPNWSFAVSAQAASGVYLRGDEANLNAKTDSYVVFNVSSTYRFSDTLEFFATITNLFDAKYETFGAFSPTADIPMAEAPGAADPRSLSPAPPFSLFGGVRVHL